MKAYVKPSLEVISMKTSENIADGNGNIVADVLASVYVKASEGTEYSYASTAEYDSTGIADSATTN